MNDSPFLNVAVAHKIIVYLYKSFSIPLHVSLKLQGFLDYQSKCKILSHSFLYQFSLSAGYP